MNLFARSIQLTCKVIVSHRFEDLSAHVELDGDIVAEPGDRVLVDGPPINPPYGEVRSERRRATLTRASVFLPKPSTEWCGRRGPNPSSAASISCSAIDRRIRVEPGNASCPAAI